MNKVIAKSLAVSGIVQGVGFRPFIWQLAQEYRVRGDVANTPAGVLIHAEGAAESVAAFCRDIETRKPPLAHITGISARPESPAGAETFSIVPSEKGADTSALISPDVSVCEDCLREMCDPSDRRYRYPFINCTHCGPRYTIIDDIPYDRPGTSMRHFTMCPACQSEYDNPADRRFHAQPNACPVCGPHVTLCDNARCPVPADDPVQKTVELLRDGHIVAVKGIGGFHLAADAENSDAVRRLRERKHREEKPFALMALDLEQIRRFARPTPEEVQLLTVCQRPIVLLRKRTPNSVAEAVSPRNRCFGVMLPYTPLHYLLLGAGADQPNFTALVMTSGNMSEAPIAIDNDDAFDRLAPIADFFLIHNREICLRSDDSIVRYAGGDMRPIRRSRGYAPMPVFLRKPVPQILACGGGLKSTVCLTKGRNAFLSQHIGDMENLETFDFFRQTVDRLRRILSIRPEIVAHDLHPDYMSTQYALEQADVKTVAVQHHHAHIVSVMAEHQLDGPLIGLAFDGTGCGTDGAIWGGEVLIAEPGTFTRAAHLGYVPMPGGSAAIREPWRMGLACLYETFGDSLPDLPMLREIGEERAGVMLAMIRNQVNTPRTSSMGRLFDGIAAILGLRSQVAFEGQAAMDLEMVAEEGTRGGYEYERTPGDIVVLPVRPIVRGVVADMGKGLSPSVISMKFHNTLIRLFSELCRDLRGAAGLNRVVLSGGVFQNAILLTGLMHALEKENFKVFANTQVPANDGGISLGQALVAAERS